MSSYSHLLDNYLNTNTKSNSSLQLPPQTSMSSRLLRHEETTKYRDSPSQLASQYTPLPRASAYNPRFNDNNTSGGLDHRATYSSRPADLSENMIRPSYVRDSSMKQQTGGRMNLQQLQERRNIANTISPTHHSGRANDIDSIRKKHEDRTNTALNDLLNFKPFESYTTRKNIERKDHSYNNILKEIDDCVSNMKKYSSRGTVNQSRNSAINYEQQPGRRDIQDRSPTPKYVNETSRDYSNLQEYPARPQASFEYQNTHNISAFLPKPSTTPKNGKRLTQNSTPVEPRAQAFERVHEAQENILEDSLSSPESESERKPPRSQKSSRKTAKQQKTDEHKEMRRESSEFDRERQGLSRKSSRKEIVEDKKENSVSREENKEKNNIVELLKSQLNKENLSGESGDLAEILAKTVMKVMQNMPKQENPKEQEKEKNLSVSAGVNTEQEPVRNGSKAAKGRMIIEKLEPLSYVPPEKPVLRTETRTCETQTENQENIQSFRNERNGYTPTTEYAPSYLTHESHENYFGRGQNENYERSRTNMTPYANDQNIRSQHKYEQERHQNFREERDQHDFFQTPSHISHIEQNVLTQNEYEQKNYGPRLTEKFLDTSISQSRIEPTNISMTQEKPPTGKKALTVGTGTKTPQEANFGYGKTEENNNTNQVITPQRTPTHQTPINQERNTWLQGSDRKDSRSNSFIQDYEKEPIRPSNNLSASKGRSSLKNLGNQVGQKSPAGMFSPGLKNDKTVENAFFDKVHSMQETFSAFLKQKIQEVQAINHQYTANKETIKSPVYKENPALKGHIEQSPARDTSPLQETKTQGLFKSASAATGIQAYPGNKTLPKQISREEREERAAELPMVRNVERRVPSISKKKGEWVQLKFQEEKEVDKIIESYI